MNFDTIKAIFQRFFDNFKHPESLDDSVKEFLNAIENGRNKTYQKVLTQVKVFEGSWITQVEEGMKSIDEIVRNPRNFIRDDEYIVPIELVRKTTRDSVKHLTMNTRYIKDVTESGDVIPEKLLNKFKEEDLAIYENRFVKSLIDKLIVFMEKRYNLIKKMIGVDFVSHFQMESSFDYDDSEIEYVLSISQKRETSMMEVEIKNFELVERIERIRRELMSYRNTTFMEQLLRARPVYPPIQKTNILTKDPDYKACYELWHFLDEFENISYDSEIYEKEVPFHSEYIEELKKIVLFNYLVVTSKVDARDKFFNENQQLIKSLSNQMAVTELEEAIRNNEIDRKDMIYSELIKELNEGYLKKVTITSAEDVRAELESFTSDELKQSLEVLNGVIGELNAEEMEEETLHSIRRRLKKMEEKTLINKEFIEEVLRKHEYILDNIEKVKLLVEDD